MRRLWRPLVWLGALGVLGACGEDARPQGTSAQAAATQSVQALQLDELHLSARVIPTMQMEAAAADRYGIPRGEDVAMLLVLVRSAGGDAVADAGLQLNASVGELHVAPQPLPLQRLQVDAYVDYVGVIRASPPATLRITLEAARAGRQARIGFSHDLSR